MRIHPSPFRHPMMAGLLALLAGLAFVLAAAPDLATIDLSFGGGTAVESTPVEPSVPMNPEVTNPSKPAWVTDPMASPVDVLAGR